MPTFKLTIAYDGTAYAGWQVQADRQTVQGVLEEAVERITGQTARVTASGRTDAGVHALGQVVAFKTDSDLPVDVLQRAINAETPQDIVVLEAVEVAAGFHPIRDAVKKRYRYVIHDGPLADVFNRQYCWHYRHGRLDVEAMDRAAAALLGKHDFKSFESSGAERETSVRTVSYLNVRRDVAEQGRAGGGDRIILEIEADGFLYNMVRAIVGTLVEVGRGAQDEAWPGRVLQETDRRAAGPTAPPQGLFLLKVDY